jgi:hypothetical protein
MLAQSYDPGMIENSFFKLYITHLATSQTIDFRGWVTSFSDQFTSNWNTETVYGRMDPLATFQNTQRQISLEFDVVSGDADQAAQNLGKINSLISFLYPVYESDQRGVQNTLQAAPLIGLRWTNLVADSTDGSQLVGYLGGASYAPDLAQGGFINGQKYEKLGYKSGTNSYKDQGKTKDVKYIIDRTGEEMNFIPKVVSLNLDFTVLHKHLTGWSKSDGSKEYSFGKGKKMFPNAAFVGVPGSVQDTMSESPLRKDSTAPRTTTIQRSAQDTILSGDN